MVIRAARYQHWCVLFMRPKQGAERWQTPQGWGIYHESYSAPKANGEINYDSRPVILPTKAQAQAKCREIRRGSPEYRCRVGILSYSARDG
jgi:hypothetical protein